jgi:hypothetical protein
MENRQIENVFDGYVKGEFMEDNRFKQFKNCRIMAVYEKKMRNIKDTGTYLIEIEIEQEGSCFSRYLDIKIDKHNLYKELQTLVKGEVQRLYLAHGMADIDIYKRGDKYCIDWSPSDSNYNEMYFEEENFIFNFVDALESNEKKQY